MSEEGMRQDFDLLKDLLHEDNPRKKPDPGASAQVLMQYVQTLTEKVNKRATLVRNGVFDMGDESDRDKYENIINSERYTILSNSGAWVPYEYRSGKEDVEKDSSYKIYLQYKEVSTERLVKVLREYLAQPNTMVTLDLLKSIVVSKFDWMLEEQVVKDFLADVETKKEEQLTAVSKTEDASDKKHAEKMVSAVNKPLTDDLPRLKRLYVGLQSQLARRMGIKPEELDMSKLPAGHEKYVEALAKLEGVIKEKTGDAEPLPAEEEDLSKVLETAVRESLAPAANTESDVIEGPKDVKELVFNEAVIYTPDNLVEELLAPATTSAPVADDLPASGHRGVDHVNPVRVPENIEIPPLIHDVPAPTPNKTNKIPEVA